MCNIIFLLSINKKLVCPFVGQDAIPYDLLETESNLGVDIQSVPCEVIHQTL